MNGKMAKLLRRMARKSLDRINPGSTENSYKRIGPFRKVVPVLDAKGKPMTDIDDDGKKTAKTSILTVYTVVLNPNCERAIYQTLKNGMKSGQISA